ncbi:hypothetical protein Scel_55790 [Streptomyces cellostaticus]|nr:hypothetical protein Scel_55790 [Streptomyces cellostaticus]
MPCTTTRRPTSEHTTAASSHRSKATDLRLTAQSCYKFLYLIKGPRTARAGPLGPAPCAFGARAVPLGPQRATALSRDLEGQALGQNNASGGGSADTGMEGAPFPAAGSSWRAWGAPIPYTVDPGRAEQTRPMASRSFVQWRAPPGRHEPRPLHGVWVDGVRDGSWGGWWVGVRGLVSAEELTSVTDINVGRQGQTVTARYD